MTPIIVGTISVFFLCKPFLARIKYSADNIEVNKNDENEFIELVYLLCDYLKVKKPYRVFFDSEVNASASFDNSFSGVILGRVNLTVGLPLLETFSVSNLLGILAHEFGHFSQKSGMRLTYIIGSINSWFYRVVFERDEWDDRLENLLEKTDFRLKLILLIAKGMIFLSRKILHGLWFVGTIVSRYTLRQMEFEADKYESFLIGKNSFRENMIHFSALSYSNYISRKKLKEIYGSNMLIDNLPKFCGLNYKKIDRNEQDKIFEKSLSAETSFFDTHPSDKERIDAVNKYNNKGILNIQAPIRDLIKKIDFYSKELTASFYKYNNISEDEIKNIAITCDKFEELEKIRITEEEAFDHIFMNSINYYEGYFIEEISDLDSAGIEEFRKLGNMINVSEAENHNDKYHKNIVSLENISQVKLFVEMNIDVNLENFGIESCDSQYLENRAKEIMKYIKKNKNYFCKMKEINNRRISIILNLASANDKQAIRTNIQNLNFMKDSKEKLNQLKSKLNILSVMMDNFNNFHELDSYNDAIKKLTNDIHCDINTIKDNYSHTIYPYDELNQDISIGTYLLETVPAPTQISDIYNAGESLIYKYNRYCYRALVNIALEIKKYI